MKVDDFLKRMKGLKFVRQQAVAVRSIPPRPPRYSQVPGGLRREVAEVLNDGGITRLWEHQSQAIDQVRQGSSVVVVTGTASGKTLCYAVPIVEALLADSLSTSLLVYPTKALAQDQLRSFGRFQRPGSIEFLAGTYDGDTPTALRRRLRDGGSVILTNPDMLHSGILPQHARWNRFFTHLKYVVIDEVHAYRGVFGSHLANVIRRLRRICRHYGSDPVFICCSATIGNPRQHAEAIVGREMALVDSDGSPRGPKRFVMWNPPPLDTAGRGGDGWRIGGDRRSSVGEAINLMSALACEGVQTIAFVRTRLAAELIFKSCRERLREVSRKLADSVHAYRGGYLPEQRRAIEQRLASREILALASTNALELGIDIGSLDACILVGYPGSVASLWQRAGRAGRGREESLVFLVAQNSPIDQYLMAHDEYLFSQSPEQAVIDPDNPHIVVGHLRCAAHELPLDRDSAAAFGPYAESLLEILEEDKQVRAIDGRWYWSSSEYPAAGVGLRNIGETVYTIQDTTAAERVIGTLDETSALSQLHDHAVYLHAADTYFVTRLDIEQKIAFVERRDLDYYTQSIQTSQIRIDATELDQPWRGGKVGFGEVTVTTTIPMFKKIRFHSRDSLGCETLEMPPQQLATVAMWLQPPAAVLEEMKRRGLRVGEALVGVANVLVEVAPLYTMADPQDLAAVVDAACLGADALFVHDRHPGGMGYARRCMERIDEMLQTVAAVIKECSCPDGCPSCVGAAMPAQAMGDMDSAVRDRIPDKQAAGVLLELLLSRQALAEMTKNEIRMTKQ